jgi:hypothetical protein
MACQPTAGSVGSHKTSLDEISQGGATWRSVGARAQWSRPLDGTCGGLGLAPGAASTVVAARRPARYLGFTASRNSALTLSHCSADG